MATESPTASPTSEDERRIGVALGLWKRKLLDVSRRNRALNFRMTKVSTVAVVDEQPAEVFRRLYLQEKPMRFQALASKEGDPGGAARASSPEAPAGAEARGEDWRDVLDDMEAEDGGDVLPVTGFAPYESAALHTRHRDDVLQTSHAPDLLDRSLRRIDELAREAIEEQGVNTLFLALGMLHYRESRDSEQVYRAPLVLLPVALSRRSASAGYGVSATDDDPLVNPALAEYLKRAFGVSLPELPESATIPDDYDLQQFLSAVSAIAQPGWTVTTEIYLGLFAFQKFVMYKDLDSNGAAFAGHRLIRQLITRKGGGMALLPDEVREMALDEHFPPERTPQVVDADSSQLRAIAAVGRGYDLVLEGPPGTGKSQTITNLIAQALAAGESVLFVAEKLAALQVVYERLVRAGLGDFCLELHSTKANKRIVMKEIGRSLDASLGRLRPVESSVGRLPAVRRTLSEYTDAVHAPYGAAGFSPYRGFGELMTLRDAPRVRLERPVDGVTRERFEDTVRDLEDLATAVAGVGDPARHPWRDSGRTFWTEDDRDAARELLRDLQGRLAETRRLAAEVETGFGLPPVRTFEDVETAARVAEVMGRSPGAPLGVLRSDAWNAPPREALDLLERGKLVAGLKQRVAQRFTRDVLEQEHAADLAFIEEKESSPFRFLNVLSGRFRAVRRRWVAYRLPSYQASLLEQAGEMRKVDELRRERAALASRDETARQLFGVLWQGEGSDWSALDGYVRWVVEFRGLCVAYGLDEKAAETAARPLPDVSLAVTLRDAAAGAARTLADLCALAQWPADYLKAAPLAETAERAAALEDGVGLAPRWAAYEMVRRKVAEGLAGEMLVAATGGEVAFGDLPRAFRRAFHQKWVNAAVQEREPLRHFATLTHEQRGEEFRRLDERVLTENRDGLVMRLREGVQARLREEAGRQAMDVLRPQISRERRHAPLRRTLRQAGAAIRAIKPCFMMSPLTVAQLLDGEQPSFDLVIFDEASQLPAEDAVGAIARGRKLVVVGDPKQLPPTNFFSVMAGQEVPAAEDGTPLFEDTESVLEEFMGAGVPRTRLRWHYRSTHESLITFSNVSFYDSDLHTFPSVETASHAAGLVFRHVPDGVYEGKGLNLAEARRVADAVVRHARETPDLSLGVGTFNLRQQLAILDELEIRRREDPSLEPFFARGRPEPFFVKNLENIQGDERDVILLSVTYGRARDGKLRYNFGPINGENGWRRLNVLTTRARRRMEVFSSMRGDEISPAAASSRGPALMREFLLYAERGRLESASASAAAETESPFEREVFLELERRGLKLQPQVGVSGYRIDIGVLDDEVAGRYVCGIECDGVAYHSSETARDRDRLRQQVLESRGWEIHRIWSTDWFKDRDGQIRRILELVEMSRQRTHQEVDAAREAEAEARAREEKEAEELARKRAESPQPPVEPPPEPGSRTGVELRGEPYRMADRSPRYPGTDILQIPVPALAMVVREVAEVESPLHADDVTARLTEMWGLARAGARIARKVEEACYYAGRQGWVEMRDPFVWLPGGAPVVRSRAEVRIPAERICPEEYREAVVLVLRARGSLDRRQLTSEVRSLLGFSRTGARLEEAIGAAIGALLDTGVAGEASTGICLRG